MARRRTRGGGRRADLRWTLGGASGLAIGAGTSASTIVTQGVTSQTLMRVRGNLLCYLDGVQAPGTLVRCAAGFITVPGGLGTTVVSSPITDGDAPWLWFESWALGYEEYVTDVVDAVGASVYRAVIDSKAMRIIRPDQEVQFVFEQATVGDPGSVNIRVDARFLIAD